jgi:hypothetical protein
MLASNESNLKVLNKTFTNRIKIKSINYDFFKKHCK